jgi:hypothetical protein
MTMATLHESGAAAEAIAPLAFPFTRGGYRHVLFRREGRVCLVQRTSLDARSGGSIHYEVVVLQVASARTWPDGRRTPAHERYPEASRWGTWGWTYCSLAAAERTFGGAVAESRAHRRGEPSPLAHARREAARLDASLNQRHSERHPDPVTAPAIPRPQPDAYLGLSQRPVGRVADYPVGARVQLASGAWARIVERGSCVVTIHEPGRGTREVAPRCEVFASRRAKHEPAAVEPRRRP